jgi:hypothetical protein
MTLDEIVAGYYKNWTTLADEDFWAWEAVVELCRDLQKGFDICLRLINSSEDDLYLAYVAAGPVEDLIKWHGASAVNLFELPAQNSEKIRQAIAGVWLSPSADGFAEWQRIMLKYGLITETSHTTKMASKDLRNQPRRKRLSK